MNKITASIHGGKVGRIWMPAVHCIKPFAVTEHEFRYADGSRPSLRDMAERATNDGDFQGTDIYDGFLQLEMVTQRNDGQGHRRRVRVYDLRRFPSIADIVLREDSPLVQIALDIEANQSAD